jgi:hypothetical protein
MNTFKRRGRPPKAHKTMIERTDETLDDLARVATADPVEATVIERPPMRAPMREPDSRAEAARRAAQIRGHLGGDMDDGTDEFAAPRAPDGWTYEWKRRTIMGAEDPAYLTHLARVGWEPVATARHPEMMPHNATNPIIERKGMVLMQRPEVITQEAREIELRRARGQVRNKEEQLAAAPDGQFGRNHPQARPKISKGFEPVPVPKD